MESLTEGSLPNSRLKKVGPQMGCTRHLEESDKHNENMQE